MAYIDLLPFLKEELDNLKLFATKEELAKLAKAEFINPQNRSKCIYGIMTGTCENERASELVNKCSSMRVYGTSAMRNELKFSEKERDSDMLLFSPIEIFLFIATKNDIRNVVSFLVNNTELAKFEIEKWSYHEFEYDL